ncbi:unnamed protein product, partial [Urochloa humidicola]
PCALTSLLPAPLPLPVGHTSRARLPPIQIGFCSPPPRGVYLEAGRCSSAQRRSNPAAMSLGHHADGGRSCSPAAAGLEPHRQPWIRRRRGRGWQIEVGHGAVTVDLCRHCSVSIPLSRSPPIRASPDSSIFLSSTTMAPPVGD